MRFIVNSLVVLMVVGVLGGVVYISRQGWEDNQARDAAREELQRFQKQVAVHSQLGKAEVNDRGYPLTVEPTWFAGNLPQNPLLPRQHPWLEIADASQVDRLHPMVWATADPSVPRYWYNPGRGVVRARVPFEAAETHALELYNFVNGTTLTAPPY